MRSLLALAVTLLATHLPAACAGGERGIAERMLYWCAYICDERNAALVKQYYGETLTMTVAPDCKGSRAGRCTFDELMMDIWKTDPNSKIDGTSITDTTQPKSMKTPSNIDDKLAISFDKFFAQANQAEFATGFKLDGKTDGAKLLPGVSGGSYYDVLDAMGDPIKAYSDSVMRIKGDQKEGGSLAITDDKPVLKVNNAVTKPWTWGKESAAFVRALRRKNMDGFRQKFLKDYFSKPENKPSGLTDDFKCAIQELDTLSTQKIEAIDFAKTIENYKAVIPDIETRLGAAQQGFLDVVHGTTGEKINAEHQKAVHAADGAATRCACHRKYSAGIKKKKKRQLFSKAEKSRRMKAKLLASKTPLKYAVRS